MSEEQRENIAEQLKAWSFPIMLSVIGFFGVQMMRELNDMKVSVKSIENNTINLQKDVEYLRRDTSVLQNDVQNLKKTFDNEH